MTHEQREQAAEVLEKFQNGIYGHGGKVGVAIDIAIAALRGPQPDPDTGLVPCDYCNETHEQKPLLQENNYEPYTGMMSTISIEEYNGKHQIEIDLWDSGNFYAAFEINYCPMCGRKLEVEG